MALVNGATYRLQSRADTKRSLNVYGTSPASLANVCLYTNDNNDICQQWVYKKSGSREYFVCKGNQNLALDLFTGSSSAANVKNYNAHVYAPSETSYITVEEISGGYIRIKLDYNDRYLTANQGSNGTSGGKDVNAAGNVYFYNGGLTDLSQDWKPILLDGTTPDPEPGKSQTLVSPYPCATITCGYNAPVSGAACGCYPYSFHIGTDFIGATNDKTSASYTTSISASGKGKVVYIERAGETTNLGNMLVIRYDNVKNTNGGSYDHVLFRYCHLNSILVSKGANVFAGTPIATQGTSGQGCAPNASHLHLEVTTDPEELAHASRSNGFTNGTTIDIMSVLHNKNTTSDIGMRKTIKDTEGVFQYRSESGEYCAHGHQWYDGDAIDNIPSATNVIIQ